MPVDTEPEIVTVPERATAVVRGKVPFEELAPFFDRAFTTLGEALAAGRVAPDGPAFALYHGAPRPVAEVEAGFTVAHPAEPGGEVVAGTLPGGRVARLLHHGPYDTLGDSWERLVAWTQAEGLAPGPVMWEVYATQPTPDTDPADLRTELYLPLAS